MSFDPNVASLVGVAITTTMVGVSAASTALGPGVNHVSSFLLRRGGWRLTEFGRINAKRRKAEKRVRKLSEKAATKTLSEEANKELQGRISDEQKEAAVFRRRLRRASPKIRKAASVAGFSTSLVVFTGTLSGIRGNVSLGEFTPNPLTWVDVELRHVERADWINVGVPFIDDVAIGLGDTSEKPLDELSDKRQGRLATSLAQTVVPMVGIYGLTALGCARRRKKMGLNDNLKKASISDAWNKLRRPAMAAMILNGTGFTLNPYTNGDSYVLGIDYNTHNSLVTFGDFSFDSTIDVSNIVSFNVDPDELMLDIDFNGDLIVSQLGNASEAYSSMVINGTNRALPDSAAKDKVINLLEHEL